jgi:hypothetical protein
LFKKYKREDSLWDSDVLNVRSELGFVNYDNMPSEAERLRRELAKAPDDVAYSSYHRHSELGVLLRNSAPKHIWDPLEGIDRYWTEHKAEARESGDFETKRLHDAILPQEGQTRIVVQDMRQGHQILGIAMTGLRVVGVVDPKAYELGWRVGDEVLKVNRIPVSNELEFREALSRAISRNRLAAAPVIFDVWREPLRSAHHNMPMPQGVPLGTQSLTFGMPMHPAALTQGPLMMPGPGVMMRPRPGPMQSPNGGLQQHMAALAHENAMLRRQLGEQPQGFFPW